jgi:sugar lactone lactonase YvrE/enterochelin esterase-like enzyme
MDWNWMPILLMMCAPLAMLQEASGATATPAPKGEVTKYEFAASKIFPGTVREYWVYVPKQYDPARPACVYVGQDGIGYNAPEVFDKLIAAGEMPVTIGVFIRPGGTRSFRDNVEWRPNRSYEYDSVNDNYVRFLLEEMLPEVERKQTADGRPIHLSHSGNDRAIAGGSSGGIAAFNAAWQRPDAFSRVYSSVGSYTNLRGGNSLQNLVRKCEPKPIRIYMQSGTHDARFLCGDWWMANQEMERALSISGYEVNHTWGEGDHGSPQQVEIFPDVMRWLWKDWPKPVKAGTGSEYLQAVTLPGVGWQQVVTGPCTITALAADAQGEVFFSAASSNKIYRLDAAGKPREFLADARHARGMAWGPDGRLYLASAATKQVLACTTQGQVSVLAEGLAAGALTVLHNGHIYVTETNTAEPEAGKLWLLAGGKKTLLDEALPAPTALIFSPDQARLHVASATSRFVLSYMLHPDGAVGNREPFYILEAPVEPEACGATAVQADRGVWIYTATQLGVQVSDVEGRVLAILAPPAGRITSMCFGGEKFDTLYVASGGAIYQRKLKVQGATAF